MEFRYFLPSHQSWEPQEQVWWGEETSEPCQWCQEIRASGLIVLGSQGGPEAEGFFGEMYLLSQFVDLWVSTAVSDDTWKVWLTRLTDAPG